MDYDFPVAGYSLLVKISNQQSMTSNQEQVISNQQRES
jgi:hypothetical protein